jgi:hypothetical protein
MGCPPRYTLRKMLGDGPPERKNLLKCQHKGIIFINHKPTFTKSSVYLNRIRPLLFSLILSQSLLCRPDPRTMPIRSAAPSSWPPCTRRKVKNKLWLTIFWPTAARKGDLGTALGPDLWAPRYSLGRRRSRSSRRTSQHGRAWKSRAENSPFLGSSRNCAPSICRVFLLLRVLFP